MGAKRRYGHRTNRVNYSPRGYRYVDFETLRQSADLIESASKRTTRTIEFGGILERNRVNELSARERKEALLQAYLDNTWVSSAIETIAKRITSGGWTIEPTEQSKGNESHREILRNFFKYINNQWDFNQFMRSIIIDLLIYGECFVEVICEGKTPVSMVKINCITMTTQSDDKENVTGYTQRIDTTHDPIFFAPDAIIRWWLPHPRKGIDPFSPVEKCINAVYADKHMVQWLQNFFRRGAKHPYVVLTEGDITTGSRFIQFFQENYIGEKNAHIPLVLPLGAKVQEFSKGVIDVDFSGGRIKNREEILSAFGTPPATVGIIETANLGSGSGDSQDKTLQFNTTDPIKQIIMEKFNYRIVQEGFDIHDYVIGVKYADYRNDKDVVGVQNERVRGGLSTLNEVRQEMGREPYNDCGDTPIYAMTKEVVALATLNDIEDEHKNDIEVTLAQKQAQVDLLKAQIQKLKEPPPPPPAHAVEPSQLDHPPLPQQEPPTNKNRQKVAVDPSLKKTAKQAEECVSNDGYVVEQGRGG